ncbi:hypothetical protein [uncultured Rhodospira sp.]|uniref:hypothetical protein n=1 Tax=uncultured Rhodospira sp. TaxID=1936189 RepID=UPI0026224B30|nr:hypothetical protein [uncultured Rhodospira sp.]
MASVAEIKSALLQERQELADIAALALTSMDTLLALSMFVLSAIGLLIAVLSIIGVVWLVRVARRNATKVANERLDSYLESQVFRDLMESMVANAVDRKWQNTVVVTRLDTHDQQAGGHAEFPAPRGARSDDSH